MDRDIMNERIIENHSKTIQIQNKLIKKLQEQQKTLRDEFAMALAPSIYEESNSVSHICTVLGLSQEEYRWADHFYYFVMKESYRLADEAMKAREATK